MKLGGKTSGSVPILPVGGVESLQETWFGWQTQGMNGAYLGLKRLLWFSLGERIPKEQGLAEG